MNIRSPIYRPNNHSAQLPGVLAYHGILQTKQSAEKVKRT